MKHTWTEFNLDNLETSSQKRHKLALSALVSIPRSGTEIQDRDTRI